MRALVALFVAALTAPAWAAPSSDLPSLPNTATIGASGGIALPTPGPAFGGRASFGWGFPSGSISLGYRALLSRSSQQHQGELLFLRYVSPESEPPVTGTELVSTVA